MKWSSFQSFTANNFELGHVLDWHIGPPAGFDTRTERRKWIEEKVLRVRSVPWDKLQLEEKGAIGPRYRREWWIHFHIKHDEQSRRLKCTFDLATDASLAALIDNLKQWHIEGWGKPAGECESWVIHPGDHPMIVDAIVCSHMHWEPGETFTQSLDLYIPPKRTTL